MERYDKYINTGVSWMPRIPSHWKHVQFRGLFKITKRIAGRTGLDVLAVTQRGIKVKDVESNEGQIAADYSNYQIVEPGDFAMNHMDLITGFVGISPQYGVTSPDYRVFKNISPLVSSQFYLYIFELCYKQQIFYGLGHGVSNKGRWRLPAPIQNRFEIPLPPLAEQEKIVSYLEDKTSKIDAYVADKEKEIVLLQELKQKTIADAVTKGLNPDAKMKDSGISWIGEIPEHWEMRKLSQVSYEHFISNKTVHHQNLLSLSYGRIIRKDINKTEGLLPASFDTYQIVEDGNIVLRLTDLQNDQKSLRVGLAKEEGIVTSAYVCLGVYDSMIPAYLYNILHSYDIKKLFYSMGGGIRQGLNWQGLKKIDVPLPPLDEQRAIVAYIEEMCQKIDTLTTELQAEMDYLKEYKQRLIADVVTGQVNVQNINI